MFSEYGLTEMVIDSGTVPRNQIRISVLNKGMTHHADLVFANDHFIIPRYLVISTWQCAN